MSILHTSGLVPARWARFGRGEANENSLGVIAAAFVFMSGCAKEDWIDRTLVTVDVTGTWEGTSSDGLRLLFELEQKGSTVKGFMRVIAGSNQNSSMGIRPGPVDGTVAGDVFRFMTGRSIGELTVSEDEMNGYAAITLVNGPLLLRRIACPSSQEDSQPLGEGSPRHSGWPLRRGKGDMRAA